MSSFSYSNNEQKFNTWQNRNYHSGFGFIQWPMGGGYKLAQPLNLSHWTILKIYYWPGNKWEPKQLTFHFIISTRSKDFGKNGFFSTPCISKKERFRTYVCRNLFKGIEHVVQMCLHYFRASWQICTILHIFNFYFELSIGTILSDFKIMSCLK